MVKRESFVVDLHAERQFKGRIYEFLAVQVKGTLSLMSER